METFDTTTLIYVALGIGVIYLIAYLYTKFFNNDD